MGDFDDRLTARAEAYAEETDPAKLADAVRRRLDWRLRRGFKVCGSCGLRKPVSAFGRDASRRDGLEVRCRLCRRAAHD